MPSRVSDDPQCDSLHDAEREFYPKRKGRYDYAGRLTRKEARQLVAEVRRLYGLPQVFLRFVDQPYSRASAWALHSYGADNEVRSSTITVSGVNPVTAHLMLHEVGHVVTDYVFGPDMEAHGPEFVGILSWLFNYFQIIPSDAFGLVLRRHGVKRRSPHWCSPAALKKYRTRRRRC